MPCHIEQTLATIEQFDGSIPWMYLDAKGSVVVGAGMTLPTPAAAARLPFQVGSRAAIPDEIAAEFNRVANLPVGSPALFYREPGSPELEPAVLETLLRTYLVGLEEHLREHVADYDHLPPSARMVLLDMAHSLTPAALLSQYPHLLQTIETGAWSQAAAQSFRPGSGAARNQWAAAMFRASAPVSPKEGPLSHFAYGLIGLTATVADRIWNRS